MFLPLLDYLAESFGPFRVFNYFTFRAILSTLTALIFCVDINSKIKSEKINYLSKSDIVINLSRFFDKQTLILFKASRSVKMENLIDLI